MSRQRKAASPNSPVLGATPAIVSPNARSGMRVNTRIAGTLGTADKMTGLRPANDRAMRSLRSHRTATAESQGFTFANGTDTAQKESENVGSHVAIPSHVAAVIFSGMPQWRDDGTAALPDPTSSVVTEDDSDASASVSSSLRHGAQRGGDITGDLTDGGYYATPSYSAVEASLSLGNSSTGAQPAKRAIGFARVGGGGGGENGCTSSSGAGPSGSGGGGGGTTRHNGPGQRRARRGSTSVTICTPGPGKPSAGSYEAKNAESAAKCGETQPDPPAQGTAARVLLLQKRRTSDPPLLPSFDAPPAAVPAALQPPPTPSVHRHVASPAPGRSSGGGAAASVTSNNSTASPTTPQSARLAPTAAAASRPARVTPTPPAQQPVAVFPPPSTASSGGAGGALRRAPAESKNGSSSLVVASPKAQTLPSLARNAPAPSSPPSRRTTRDEDDEDPEGQPGAAAAQFYSRAQLAENHDGAKYLNDYMVFHDVGRGASGKVVMGYSSIYNRTVAIKIITRPKKKKYQFLRAPSILTSDQDIGSGDGAGTRTEEQGLDVQLQREIDVMKTLNHKNVVSLYEVINDPSSNKIYLIMQYIDKGAIGTIDPDGRLDKPFTSLEVARIAVQAASGLAYLHKKGVVHRDIKPENMLMNSEGTVFLADFGVAEMFPDEDAIATVDKLGFQGTPLFMAPEVYVRPSDVAMLQERYGAASSSSTSNLLNSKMTPGFPKIDLFALDIWAFGVTLVTLLTGEVPLKRVQDIRQLLVDGQASLPLPARVPPIWRPLLTSMLQTNQKKRPSAREVKQSTKNLLDRLERAEKQETRFVMDQRVDEDEDAVMVVSDTENDGPAPFVPLRSTQFSPSLDDGLRTVGAVNENSISHPVLVHRRTTTTTTDGTGTESKNGATSTLPSLADTASRNGQSPERVEMLRPNFVDDPAFMGSPVFSPLAGVNSGAMAVHRRSLTSGVSTPAVRRSTTFENSGEGGGKGNAKASLYKVAMNEKMS